MIAYFNENGRYTWTGNESVMVDGAPPPPANPFAIGAFGRYDGVVDQLTQYHDLKKNVPVDIPAAPSVYHVFNWEVKKWQYPKTLDNFQLSKWAEIKAARLAASEQPLITPYGVFDAKEKDQRNIKDQLLIANTLTALGAPVEIPFTLYDNTVLIMNADMIMQVVLLLNAQIKDARNRATELREVIFSDNIKPAALAAIQWAKNG